MSTRVRRSASRAREKASPSRRGGCRGLILAVALLACAPACSGRPPEGARRDLPPAGEGVHLDHFGYRPRDPKVAVLTVDPGPVVEVRASSGDVAFSVPGDGGAITRRGRDRLSGDDVWWVDFTPLRRPGTYHLVSPRLGVRSYDFDVAEDVYRAVLRSALRTFYLQRCGVARPKAFAGPWEDAGACHRSDATVGPAPGSVDRGVRDLSGGWHDAGDYNKYLWYAASNAVLYLLDAWERDPTAFADGALGIPESGNGIPDVLDEVRWELDFFLKMQLPDGSALSQVHAAGSANGVSPPSADTTRRYYLDPGVESGAVLAGSCALASRAFETAGEVDYARTLRRAALAAWGWLEGQGTGAEKVWAAAEVFRLDPTVLTARAFVDRYHADWSAARLGPTSYETHAALAYVRATRATPVVAAAMRAGLATAVEAVFSSDDLYRNGMAETSYHWGSNAVRAGSGVFLLRAARLGITGSRTPEECRTHAQDLLHYFHGQNPLGMVFLTNMAALGGEHSSWQFFHNWFGQPRDPYSRSHFVGKPPRVAEPAYPYFPGIDNHGVRDDKASLLGPPPGFVPGGPNGAYSGDSLPPAGALPARSYRDWNDQDAWTARTWEITESSIGYQGPYVALVAAFTGSSARDPDIARSREATTE